jgi:hypothetical protein
MSLSRGARHRPVHKTREPSTPEHRSIDSDSELRVTAAQLHDVSSGPQLELIDHAPIPAAADHHPATRVRQPPSKCRSSAPGVPPGAAAGRLGDRNSGSGARNERSERTPRPRQLPTCSRPHQSRSHSLASSGPPGRQMRVSVCSQEVPGVRHVRVGLDAVIAVNVWERRIEGGDRDRSSDRCPRARILGRASVLNGCSARAEIGA